VKALVAILDVLLRALLPILFERSKPTAEDSRRNTQLRDSLRRRVRQSWGKGGLACVCLAVILLLPGCGIRTVYVPSGEPVRLRETVKRARSGSRTRMASPFRASWTCRRAGTASTHPTPSRSE